MNNKNIEDKEHYHLLITPELTSQSKRFYKLFKPKEIIEFEGYDLCFKITNLGKISFPGGTIKNLRICYPDGKCEETHNDIPISEIPGREENKENIIRTNPSKGIAIKSGIAWIRLTIISMDRKEVKYYMLDRVIGEKKEIQVLKPEWEDCFQVASRHEIHQRYTNYLLLVLTIVSTLLFLKNL